MASIGGTAVRAFVASVALALAPGVALGAILVVDDDGQATASECNSTAPTPYAGIAAGITAASSGSA